MISEINIEERKRNDVIDGLRAFSAIGSVLMHVLSNGKYNIDGFVFTSIGTVIGVVIFAKVTQWLLTQARRATKKKVSSQEA